MNPDFPWVVLCYDPSAQNDKWVVWFADDAGNTSVGRYHPTLAEARADFGSRQTGKPVILN